MLKIRKHLKKGFTLVELVIVIAVIAVLSAVSVVAYTAIVKKAEQSVDNSLVSQLNNIINLGNHEGRSLVTLHDTLGYINEQNLDISQISSKGDNEILWDSIEREFITVAADEDLSSPSQYFKIYDEIPDISRQKYSIYLNNSEVDLSTVNVKVGFDPGSNTSLGNLNYTNDSEIAQNVVIRTNSPTCVLTVNAPLDTVRHYGECERSNLDAVSTSSYFEYGACSFASFTQGRIVFSSKAKVNNLHIHSNSVIIAKESNASLPKITIQQGVTSATFQIVNSTGEPEQQSNLTIENNVVTSSGDVSTESINELKDAFDATPVNEFSLRMALKYQVRKGAEVEGDESNYYPTIQEAFNATNVALTTATTFYLLQDVKVNETIVLSGTATKAHTFNLQNHTIEGINCSPLSVTIAGANFVITGGTLKAGTNCSAVIYNNATKGNYLQVAKVDTIGSIACTGYATSYIRVNEGTHTNFSTTGKVILCVTGKDTYFDADPTNITNIKRCKIEQVNGLWKLSKATQNTTYPILSALDNITYYESVKQLLEYEEFPTVSFKILTTPYTENDIPEITKAITVACAKKANVANLTLKTSTTMSLSTGTYNISEIKCTTLTVGSNSTITVTNGVINKITMKANSGKLTINGGTVKSTTTVNSAYTATLIINGGLFKGNLSVSGSGTKHVIKVMGGTYNTSTIYNTFKDYLQEGYQVKTVGSTRVVEAIETE